MAEYRTVTAVAAVTQNSISADGAVSISIFDVTADAQKVVNGERYTGDYEVTPSGETQTLDTAGKILTEPVVVNPIPSNYGLITWNGVFLTVS